MLRILHTESSWGWGGQELRILTESQALAARGHQVCIAAPASTPILHRAQEMKLETHDLPIRKKTLAGIFAVWRFLRSRTFDVVNTHSSTDSWLVAIASLGLGQKPAIVRTRHVSTPVRAGWSNRWLFGHATARVVTTGEAIRNALIAHLGLPPDHVVSIPTGVSAELYRPVDPGERTSLRHHLAMKEGKLIIGTVATLRQLKGVNYLFQAMAKLRRHAVHLYVIGDGPQMQNLQALLDELELRQSVTMVGEQSNVDEWLRAMDIFAFPSLAEGVPQALAQAMLTELPCVTTNVGGIPELAMHLRTAWVCPPRDSDALVEGIEGLVIDHGLRRKLGVAARKHCIATRSVAHMADAMEEVFRQASQARH